MYEIQIVSINYNSLCVVIIYIIRDVGVFFWIIRSITDTVCVLEYQKVQSKSYSFKDVVDRNYLCIDLTIITSLHSRIIYYIRVICECKFVITSEKFWWFHLQHVTWNNVLEMQTNIFFNVRFHYSRKWSGVTTRDVWKLTCAVLADSLLKHCTSTIFCKINNLNIQNNSYITEN